MRREGTVRREGALRAAWPLGGGRVPSPPPGPALRDRWLLALAGLQHGVVRREQAHAVGFDDPAIAHRIRTGRLHRVQLGVLGVGIPVATPEARRAAALLAAGDEALVSHADAGECWRLPGVRAAVGRVELVVPPERVVRRPGVLAHRSTVAAADRRRVAGLAVTSAARTLLDLAPRLGAEGFEAAVADARRRHLLRSGELAELLARSHRRPGATLVREVLAREGGPLLTRSPPERRLVGLLRAHGVGGFDTNVPLLRFEVDLLWRRERLVVEVDAYGTHGDPRAFEADRRRDAELLAAGYRVLRVTRRQLIDDPDGVLAHVVAALAAGP